MSDATGKPLESADLTPAEATQLFHESLAGARRAFERTGLDAALGGYLHALGLALQLGPAPAEEALRAMLQLAHRLARRDDAQGLARLGPSVVDLVGRVGEAGALPGTPVMEAWATVAADVGTLVGQVGLALSIPAEHRAGMLDNARRRAALLDDATGNLFALTAWLDQLHPSPAI